MKFLLYYSLFRFAGRRRKFVIKWKVIEVVKVFPCLDLTVLSVFFSLNFSFLSIKATKVLVLKAAVELLCSFRVSNKAKFSQIYNLLLNAVRKKKKYMAP